MQPSPALRRAAANLFVDAATVKVVAALGEAGVRAVLLKGPAIARRLYAPGQRRYGDVDLLIAPGAQGQAQAVLRGLGYAPDPQGHTAFGSAPAATRESHRRAPGIAPHATVWLKPGHAAVDLHVSFHGLRADPALVWEALSATSERLKLGGGAVDVLELPEQALVIALHAHVDASRLGGAGSHASEDLRRALAQLPLETWARALDRARQLEAEGAFVAGLSLEDAGAEVARQIGAGPPLERRANPAPARFLDAWLQAPGARAKLSLGVGLLLPAPDYLVARWPFARRGRLGLAAAYGLHACRATLRLPGAVLHLTRARRGGGGAS